MNMRMTIPLFLLAMLCPAFTDAQIGEQLNIGKNTCSHFGEVLPDKVVTFDSDKEAEDVIANIVRASGLAKNFEVKAAGIPNAAAVIRGETRFVLYDQYFVRNLTQKTATKWAAISVMAHEIGHHLNGHTLSQSGSRPKIELEADYYSGFILQKLGATLEEARKAMETFGSQNGSETHPKKSDRLAAIGSGWTESCSKDARCSSAKSNDPPPVAKPAVVTKPAKPGPDSCEYARDGTCDEPDLCDPGTDTTDCAKVKVPPRTPYCCDAYGNNRCQIVAGTTQLGASCFCPGQGYGVICR